MERLIGKLEEFKEGTLRSLERVESRFDKIDEKLDALSSFRWQLLGGAAAISVVVSIVGFIVSNK